MSAAEPASRMEEFKAAFKKALITFVVLDAVLVAALVVLYFTVFRPQVDKVAEARDHALRTGVALEARARCVEARYALTVMDFSAARMAAGDVRARLLALAERVPGDEPGEAAEVKQLADRAALIEGAIETDPAEARKNLEVLEAKLSALYPPPPPLGKPKRR
jgi:hypothetical protein